MQLHTIEPLIRNLSLVLEFKNTNLNKVPYPKYFQIIPSIFPSPKDFLTILVLFK